VAQKFHISSRTLHRKLESRNLVFREVLKETRKQLVIEYLKEGHLRLAEIALLLGYSEQSAFNRAFSEWFGVSPREYKKLN
jgi:AraC-like DNA-binding protein